MASQQKNYACQIADKAVVVGAALIPPFPSTLPTGHDLAGLVLQMLRSPHTSTLLPQIMTPNRACLALMHCPGQWSALVGGGMLGRARVCSMPPRSNTHFQVRERGRMHRQEWRSDLATGEPVEVFRSISRHYPPPITVISNCHPSNHLQHWVSLPSPTGVRPARCRDLRHRRAPRRPPALLRRRQRLLEAARCRPAPPRVRPRTAPCLTLHPPRPRAAPRLPLHPPHSPAAG